MRILRTARESNESLGDILSEFEKTRDYGPVIAVGNGKESCNISMIRKLSNWNFVWHVEDCRALFNNLGIGPGFCNEKVVVTYKAFEDTKTSHLHLKEGYNL